MGREGWRESANESGAAMAGQAATGPVNILVVSDEVDRLLYSDQIRERFAHVDLVLSCGDLPYSYLEFILSSLNVPLYGVRGNHDHGRGYDRPDSSCFAWETADLHARTVRSHGLLLAGLEGSQRYNDGPRQYTEFDMRLQVARLLPRLLWNRFRHGRYLDILVTHAPPAYIHDKDDLPHQGFQTFRWFLRAFRPRYHLHGHIHIYNYDKDAVTKTRFHDTLVLNAYGYRQLQIDPVAPAAPAPSKGRAAA